MKTIKRNRTTLAIYQALFELLEVHNFDSITVNDICQQALVSRTTFYSYFDDKYELVIFAFKEERESLDIIKGQDIEKNLNLFLQRFKDKQIVYRNLWTSVANRELNRMISFQFRETVNYLIKDKIDDPTQKEIITLFYTGGLVVSIMHWLETGCKEEIPLLAETLISTIKNN